MRSYEFPYPETEQQTVVSRFGGIDCRTHPTKVSLSRSPDMQNMICDQNDFLVKRTGWRTQAQFDAPIYGLFADVYKRQTYTIVIMPMRSTTADARTAASHGMDIRMVQRSCDKLDSVAPPEVTIWSSVPSMSAKMCIRDSRGSATAQTRKASEQCSEAFRAVCQVWGGLCQSKFLYTSLCRCCLLYTSRCV